MNQDSIDGLNKLHTLINEIGHELKNKLGILGSTLKDISAGLHIDEESLNDSLKIYGQIHKLSKVLTNSAKICSENNNLEQHLEYLVGYFNLILPQDICNTSTKLESLTLTIDINNSTIIKSIEIRNANTKNQDEENLLEFLKYPKNSLDLIYKNLFESVFLDSQVKNIKLTLQNNDMVIVKEITIKDAVFS